MHRPESLEQIVANGLCMGCGLCESLAGSDVLRLEISARGGERPVLVGTLDARVEHQILSTCPGAQIQAPEGRAGPTFDTLWGNGMRIAKAHAVDPLVRFRGTSGGVLSALCIHLLETKQVEFILHVAASHEKPMRTSGHVSFDHAQILDGARARYGPAAPLRNLAELLDQGRRFAFVGKPCDVAAVRNLARIDARVRSLVPYMLAMVCGGTSELGMSSDYLDECGITEDDVSVFRYRGYGNPGPTHVETHDGRVFEKTYQDFWGGGESTWRLQFRCKICPDAIGEQADIVAMDAWPGANPTGEDEGFNVMIARTSAGLNLMNRAEAAGALNVLREMPFRELDGLQPHQVERRRATLARLTAYSLSTGIRPGFSGHRLVRSAIAAGLRENISNFLGTWRRVRSQPHLEDGTTPNSSDGA